MSDKNSILKNKTVKVILVILGFGLVFLFIKKTFSSPTETNNTKPGLIMQSKTDDASIDTTNESLKALNAQIQTVNDQNKKIIKKDEEIETNNKQQLADIKQELNNEVQQIKDQVSSKMNAANKNDDNAGYPVGNGGSLQNSNGHVLTWVSDMQGNSMGKDEPSANSIISSNTQQVPDTQTTLDQSPPKSIPHYTLPVNSTLFDSVTWTGLIGRIPINGMVHDPYPFKVIIGRKDFAANGINIPDIQGVIVGGYAVGDLGMGCVRGNVTSLTFVFPDGRISTTEVKGANDNNETKLGYLSTPTGNPCINGVYYGNAPEYLAGTVALGAAQGAAGAFAQSQTTAQTNGFGGVTTTLTGSPWKYIMGLSGVNAAGSAAEWWKEREQNSFDAIYVSSAQPVAVNITQEIPIDYDPRGRKVAYAFCKNNHDTTHSLD